MKKSITQNDLKAFKKSHDERYSGMARNAVSSVGILKASVDQKILMENPDIFQNVIKQGSITDQKRSGRCWMYASLNMLRVDMIKRWKLSDFQFSHGFLYFYDKLERANAYLEDAISTSDKELEDRLVNSIIFNAMEDGGFWTTFRNLAEKYGLVPAYAYEDAANVKLTDEFVRLLSKRLQKGARDLRNAYKKGKGEKELAAIKEDCMEDIYKMTVVSLGIPPKKFDLIMRDKDDKLIERRGITPKEFYEEFVKEDLDQYVIIANIPYENRKYDTLYEYSYTKVVQGSHPIQYLNLELDRMKELTKKMVLDGTPVWFGADVGQESLIDQEGNGTLAINLLNMDKLFKMDTDMSREDSLITQHSGPTHAMVFQGFDENSRGIRWKVENSWGDKVGKRGYLVMSDDWFDKYVYEVVVKKSYLNDKEKAILKTEPIVLKPWEL